MLPRRLLCSSLLPADHFIPVWNAEHLTHLLNRIRAREPPIQVGYAHTEHWRTADTSSVTADWNHIETLGIHFEMDQLIWRVLGLSCIRGEYRDLSQALFQIGNTFSSCLLRRAHLRLLARVKSRQACMLITIKARMNKWAPKPFSPSFPHAPHPNKSSAFLTTPKGEEKKNLWEEVFFFNPFVSIFNPSADKGALWMRHLLRSSPPHQPFPLSLFNPPTLPLSLCPTISLSRSWSVKWIFPDLWAPGFQGNPESHLSQFADLQWARSWLPNSTAGTNITAESRTGNAPEGSQN